MTGLTVRRHAYLLLDLSFMAHWGRNISTLHTHCYMRKWIFLQRCRESPLCWASTREAQQALPYHQLHTHCLLPSLSDDPSHRWPPFQINMKSCHFLWRNKSPVSAARRHRALLLSASLEEQGWGLHMLISTIAYSPHGYIYASK